MLSFIFATFEGANVVLKNVINHINSNFNTLASSPSLLAVSGGRDSMVLWHIFEQLKLPYQVAHVNYGLRGEESNAETELVKKTAAQVGCTLHVHWPVVPANANIQTWARKERYSFFAKLLSEQQLGRIVTAHHQNDNWEHLFIYLYRNNISAAMRGISSQIDHIYRPLLQATGKEIGTYAEKNSIVFATDSSNFKTNYLRNKVRHWLLPFLQTEDINLAQANADERYLNDFAVKGFISRCVFYETHFWAIEKKWNYSNIFLNRAMQRLGLHNSQFAQVYTMQSGGTLHCPSGQLYKTQKHLVFMATELPNCEPITTNKAEEIIDFGIYRLRIKNPHGVNLLIRSPYPGDKIKTQLGTQKVKEVLINNKIPFFLRNQVPLVEMAKEVAQVADLAKSNLLQSEIGFEIYFDMQEPYRYLL